MEKDFLFAGFGLCHGVKTKLQIEREKCYIKMPLKKNFGFSLKDFQHQGLNLVSVFKRTRIIL